MEDVYLTVKDVAGLKGCTERYVQALVLENKLSAIKLSGQATGQGGNEYRIPLSGLDDKLQLKYKREQRKFEKARIEENQEPEPEAKTVDYESLTEGERVQIAFWKGVLREWSLFRSMAANKAEADEQFIAAMNEEWAKAPPPVQVNLNKVKLYRKKKALEVSGEAGLIDKRGKHDSHPRKLTDEMFDIFEYYYLDESKKAVSLCVFLTEQELKRRYEKNPQDMPELPSRDTFERAARSIPVPYVMYYRESRMEFIGKCAPYIRRVYDDLEPNDIWVADNHTFDIMIANEEKPVRLYLTVFMDVRTRKIMGWCVTDSPSADATIYALKMGIEKYGAPKMIYTDNGREFLFHDFGGNGFRKKAKQKTGEFKLPTILEDLGIEFRTALPQNARAKSVERAFRTVKETFSKLFISYTGGNVLEKPDRLKDVLKKSELLPKVQEFNGYVNTFITGFYNKQPHSGEGMWDRSPDEIFSELPYEKRVVPEDRLNIMFMRYSKGTMVVGKNGVTLTFYGQEMQYTSDELWPKYNDEKVYVRYSPDDLNSVRVYNTDRQFICVAPLKTKLSYKASKEAVMEEQRKNKAALKTVKDYKKLKAVEAQNALDAMLDTANENLEAPETLNTPVLRVVHPNEKPLERVGVYDADDLPEPINWSEAFKRLNAGNL